MNKFKLLTAMLLGALIAYKPIVFALDYFAPQTILERNYEKDSSAYDKAYAVWQEAEYARAEALENFNNSFCDLVDYKKLNKIIIDTPQSKVDEKCEEKEAKK